MELVTSTNIYFERNGKPFIPMEETLTRCARAGFQKLDFGFAELALISETLCDLDNHHWQQELKCYQRMAKELGLEFVQAHGTILDFCHKDTNKEKLFQRSIEGAALLGIPWIVVHPSTKITNGKIDSSTHERNVEFFHRYGDYAKNLGIGLAIENMWGRTVTGEKPYCLEAEELLLLIEDVNKDNVKVCWDVEHGSVEQLDQRKAIHLLKEHIVATHISDETGINNIHILPYMGKANWHEILGALAEINYQGTFDLEIQHYLPVVPEELIDPALKFAYQVGEQMINQLNNLKKEMGYD